MCAGSTLTSLGAVHKLLTRLLAGVEEVKATQKVHSTLLHALGAAHGSDGAAVQKLPEGFVLPFMSVKDVDNAELLLKDTALQKILVCSIFKFQFADLDYRKCVRKIVRHINLLSFNFNSHEVKFCFT